MSGTQPPSTPQLWGSVTDVQNLASPGLAAQTVSRIFGESSASIAAWCAVYARQDGDELGYQLWLSAFKLLKISDLKPRS